jgi:VanZ family protein
LLIIQSIKKYWKLLTFFLSIIIIFLSLNPFLKAPDFHESDKTFHLIAYFMLAIPTGIEKPKRWVLLVFILIIFGGFIEIIQPYFNRYGEWLDFFANTLGVILGFSSGVIINKELLKNN